MHFDLDFQKIKSSHILVPGVLLSAPIITAGLQYLSKENTGWNLFPKIGAPAGIASGFVWNAGNALSIIATTNPKVGLGIAYPSKFHLHSIQLLYPLLYIQPV